MLTKIWMWDCRKISFQMCTFRIAVTFDLHTADPRTVASIHSLRLHRGPLFG